MTDPDTQTDLLQRFLSERDVECPGCGYNLRNLPGGRCPECGEGMELSLRLVEPKQGWLIGGLVGLASGLGFSGLLLIYLFITFMVYRRGGGSFFWPFFWVTGIGAVVHGVGLWLWLRNWRRIRLMSAGQRVMLVGICWGMVAVLLGVFSLAVR